MGSFLDKPVEEKETHSGEGNGLIWGLSAMQGWRVEMEDSHTAEAVIPKHESLSFFAVYDGHGGSTVSKRAGTEMLPVLCEQPGITSTDPEVQAKALRAAILALDAIFRKDPALDSGSDKSGSTMTSTLITPTHIILANVGDSRIVVARDGKVQAATIDHKPTDAGETERVKNANGFIDMGRVCGNLAVSRALGDFMYKDMPSLPAEKQKICADADLTVIPRDEKDEFVFLACDGIWDVISNEQAVEFITDHLKAGEKPAEICEKLLAHCLALNSRDNMSVCIVLLPGYPKPVEGHVAAPLATAPPPPPAQENPLGALGGIGGIDLRQLSMMFTGTPDGLGIRITEGEEFGGPSELDGVEFEDGEEEEEGEEPSVD